MYYYMFGMDPDDPGSCLRDLAARGFQAVVTGSPGEALVNAAARHGLDVYGCVGAFGLRKDFSDPAHWARDVGGIPRIWFGSGCPNDGALRDAHLNEAVRMAAMPGLRGVLADGARFASPASPEGFESFWTCFCPRCVRKAGEMGLDAGAMEKSVRALAGFPGADKETLDACLCGIAGWLEFRSLCVAEYFGLFRDVVRRSGGAIAGAFVFAACLAPLVGQPAAALASLDLVAPMLYRKYGEAQGPACLNHEWSALLGALAERRGASFTAVRDALGNMTGFDVPHGSAGDILREGFPPGTLETETRKTRASLPPRAALMPIIQLRDERLSESVGAVRGGGAQGCGFFRYAKRDMRFLPELH